MLLYFRTNHHPRYALLMMDHKGTRSKPDHENTFKAPANVSLDKVSHTAKPNINGAKKYTLATLGRGTTKPHYTDISSYCCMKRTVRPLCKTKSNIKLGASLVAQWLRICLPMQGTRVRALVWEDPTCCGVTGPMSHNYWACASAACAPQQESLR